VGRLRGDSLVLGFGSLVFRGLLLIPDWVSPGTVAALRGAFILDTFLRTFSGGAESVFLLLDLGGVSLSFSIGMVGSEEALSSPLLLFFFGPVLSNLIPTSFFLVSQMSVFLYNKNEGNDGEREIPIFSARDPKSSTATTDWSQVRVKSTENVMIFSKARKFVTVFCEFDQDIAPVFVVFLDFDIKFIVVRLCVEYGYRLFGSFLFNIKQMNSHFVRRKHNFIKWFAFHISHNQYVFFTLDIYDLTS